jgi:copper chaperone CopZ
MTETVRLNVTGMKCGGCENNVKEKLSGLAGIESVNADHKANSVEVTFDQSTINLEAIKQAIADAGYVVND